MDVAGVDDRLALSDLFEPDKFLVYLIYLILRQLMREWRLHTLGCATYLHFFNYMRHFK